MFASQIDQHEDGQDFIYVPVEDNPNLEYRIKRTEPAVGHTLPPPRRQCIGNGIDSDSEDNADPSIEDVKDRKRAAVFNQDVAQTPAERKMRHADGTPVKRPIVRRALFVADAKGEDPPEVVDDDEVVQAFDEIIKDNQPIVRALKQIDSLEERVVATMEKVLKPLLQQALAPVYQFIGAIEASASSQSAHFQWYYGFKGGNKTIFDFRLNNRHLGDNVLFVAAEYARKLAGVTQVDTADVKFVGAGIRYPRLTVNQKIMLRGDFDLDTDGAPEWIWCMIGKPCIRFMLKNETFGAVAMAAKELGYPEVKPLLDSDDVSFLFAQFVSNKFFTGPNVSMGGFNGGQRQYRVSSGILKQQANTKWLMSCKMAFQTQVYWATNMKRAGEVRDAQQELDAADAYFVANPINQNARQRFLEAQRNFFLAECQPAQLLHYDSNK